MSDVESSVRQEDINEVSQGQPQEVALQMRVTHETEKYGHNSTIFTVLFQRSENEDGFLWSRGVLPPNPSKDDTTRTFGMFHIIGIEEAVEYMEEHYDPVVNAYPTLTDPE